MIIVSCGNRRSIYVVLCWLLIILGISGCGPRELLERPAAWPGVWRGRTLYHTPQGYIYASSEAAAGEIDRLTEEVGKEFGQVTGERRAKGLLLVIDVGDEDVLPDMEFVLGLAEARAVEDGMDETEREKLDKVREDWQEKSESCGELGLELSIMYHMSAIPLDRRGIWPLDFPDGPDLEVDWAVAIPTRSAIRRAQKKLTWAAIEEKGYNLAEKALILPMLALMEGAMVDAFASIRGAVIYEEMVAGQADWPEEEKACLVEEYQNKVQDAAMSNMKGSYE